MDLPKLKFLIFSGDIGNKSTQEGNGLNNGGYVALHNLANILDSLTVWFEDIDKGEWSNRVQYYLAEYHKKYIDSNE